MPHVLISAAHKSSGKTTLSIGLSAALSRLGQRVQTFKKGPDYIDPLWLHQASQRPCHNLDFYTMSHAEIVHYVAHYGQNADMCLIEGNKGLYDGVDIEGSNSNAALAHLLGSPVILVLDTQGITRGIAPLLLGYQAFDPQLHIAGVILNKVGGARHEQKLRAVIERYTSIPVVGAVQRDPRLDIDERHLGLIPSTELMHTEEKINEIAELISQQVDLSACMNIAAQAPALLPVKLAQTEAVFYPEKLRIGVIRDSAFNFYYASDLEALERNGAELIFIDAVRDSHLPLLDGLFIGGGFPETNGQLLAANYSFKEELRQAIENDLPVYAECGGLMYLGRYIYWCDEKMKMVGALPYNTVMENKPQGRGYVKLQETAYHPWGITGNGEVYAHEFHHSRIIHLDGHFNFAYRVQRGSGMINQQDGLVYRNTLVNYAHLRDVEANPWTKRFLHFVRNCRLNQNQTLLQNDRKSLCLK
ncbi:cobyrinate a,c-diamide synthase [Thioflexithrix psekupsensis]|uniref:Cobyrinic acid a,c-diamide synthase n=1 Tax=Thioflexithrix psekupsensis TaxID=1570016 RepID=A0A251X835_9GAMM|nr:cobyrinate a,c-diamide synthase [Thioflexithrix psekupsensis]OUD14100.1 cobyrinic acid a,c-diamide synthase [Thioflexithrix psekupsensis]